MSSFKQSIEQYRLRITSAFLPVELTCARIRILSPVRGAVPRVFVLRENPPGNRSVGDPFNRPFPRSGSAPPDRRGRATSRPSPASPPARAAPPASRSTGIVDCAGDGRARRRIGGDIAAPTVPADPAGSPGGCTRRRRELVRRAARSTPRCAPASGAEPPSAQRLRTRAKPGSWRGSATPVRHGDRNVTEIVAHHPSPRRCSAKILGFSG